MSAHEQHSLNFSEKLFPDIESMGHLPVEC
jgi:hypothetical protein